MATTFVEYTGDGNATKQFTFPSVQESDVKVRVDGVLKTTSTHYNITGYTTTGGGNVVFTSGNIPNSPANIRIYRDTNVDAPKATFTAGSSVKAADLNNNTTQLLYRAQEEQSPNLIHTYDIDTAAIETSNIKADAVTGAKIADDQINSEHYVDGSIDTAHIADAQITTAKIAADAVTNAKIADDSIDSEHYVDGSIDTAHIGNSQITTDKLNNSAVTTAKVADGAITSAKLASGTVATGDLADGLISTVKISDSGVTTAKIADNAVTTAKIADSQITSAKIQDGTIVAADLASNAVTTVKITDANVTTAKIADSNVTTAKIADNSISTAKIQDGAVTSVKLSANSVGHHAIIDGNVDTAELANDAVTTAKIASNAVTTDKIADSELTTLAGMQSATASKLADTTALTADIADLNQIDGMAKQTTITDDDTKFPTSGAVVDYVAAQLEPFGGFEAIANESSFPNTQPASGVAISIADAGGMSVSGSGTASGATVGGTTVNISGIASNFHGSTIAAGVRFIVTSTGSGQNYTYHKATLKEDDLINLSGDINDFSERYRVGSSNPTSSLDSGDLFFNTSTGKLLVYNGTNTAWEEAQSIGNFFINTISSSSATGGGSATPNGTAYRFTLSNAGAVAQQHIVSVDGVIQKPNSGTSQPSEGFAVDGSDIIFGSAPVNGASLFVITCGSTVNVGTPGNNTVSSSELQNGSVTTAKIADANVTTAKITDGAVTGTKLASNIDLTDAQKIRFGNSQDLKIYHDGNHSYIDGSGTGNLILQGSIINIKNGIGTENMIKATANGAVNIYYDSSKKFETSPSGATVSGSLVITDDLYLQDNLVMGDTDEIQLGDSADLKIYHTGSQSRIENAGTGELRIQADDIQITDKEANDFHIKCIHDGAVELYHDNSKKFETTSSGATVTGTLTATSFSGDTVVGDTSPQLGGDLASNGNDILIADSDFIKFGTGNDLTIKHNGTHSIIENFTNDLYIGASTTGQIYFQKQGGDALAKFISGGAVELYHNNSKKFETTSSGVNVTGNVKADGFRLDDGDEIRIGTGDDLIIKHDSANTYISNQTGELVLNGDTIRLRKGNGLEDHLKCFADGAVELYHNGSKKLETTSTGVTVTGNVTGSLAANFTLVDVDIYDSNSQTVLSNDQQWYTDTGLGTRTISNYQRGQLIIIRAHVPMGIALSSSGPTPNYAMAKCRVKLTNGSNSTYSNDFEVWYRADGSGTHESTQARDICLLLSASNTDFNNGDNLTVSVEGYRSAGVGTMSGFIGGWNTRKQVTIERFARQLA